MQSSASHSREQRRDIFHMKARRLVPVFVIFSLLVINDNGLEVWYGKKYRAARAQDDCFFTIPNLQPALKLFFGCKFAMPDDGLPLEFKREQAVNLVNQVNFWDEEEGKAADSR